MRMCANKLCGIPPVFVVAYNFHLPEQDPKKPDTRHLVSRNDYLFKVALWSVAKPSEVEYLTDLLGAAPEPSSVGRNQSAVVRRVLQVTKGGGKLGYSDLLRALTECSGIANCASERSKQRAVRKIEPKTN